MLHAMKRVVPVGYHVDAAGRSAPVLLARAAGCDCDDVIDHAAGLELGTRLGPDVDYSSAAVDELLAAAQAAAATAAAAAAEGLCRC